MNIAATLCIFRTRLLDFSDIADEILSMAAAIEVLACCHGINLYVNMEWNRGFVKHYARCSRMPVTES